MPQSWAKKKGNKKETDALGRLYGQILRDLIEEQYKNDTEEEQSGFTSGKSRIDNIFYLKQVIEKKIAKNRTFIYVLLIYQRPTIMYR